MMGAMQLLYNISLIGIVTMKPPVYKYILIFKNKINIYPIYPTCQTLSSVTMLVCFQPDIGTYLSDRY
jgi:hypothetical protein